MGCLLSQFDGYSWPLQPWPHQSVYWPESDDISISSAIVYWEFRAYAIIVICLLLVREAGPDVDSGALFPKKPAWPCSCLTGM